MTQPQPSKDGKMGLWQAVAMAVGTMIGASIFSIFGVGAAIARSDLPEAFLLSGVYAFIVAYSYAKLGTKYISNAGPIEFILRGIGDNVVTGALSILMWLSYVVSVAMFAKGFTGYFLPLVKLSPSEINIAITVTVLILFFMVLNFFGSRAVGKTEFFIVLIKLTILMVFIAAGIIRIKQAYLTPSFDVPHTTGLIHASVIFFLSYMGFGLITNASENIRDASRNIPRAIYISIIIAMFVYVMVAVVALGNLPISKLLQVEDNALAVAARPALGDFGFMLISLGALFSISSALNATLYGGANISYSLARNGELPRFFERKVWFKSVEGLYITAGLSIVFALLFNMNGIASITSSIFTMIYIFVLISHYRLVKEAGGKRWLLVVNTIVLLAIFVGLQYFQYKSQKMVLVGTLLVFLFALVAEFIYRYTKKRMFSHEDKRKKGVRRTA